MTEAAETIPIREAHKFAPEPLSALVKKELGANLNEILQMKGGQSNPTFLLHTDKGDFVLRKQPPGTLLPSAHAVDREFRVLKALSTTDVPVPKPLLFCADPAVIGTPFYIMEKLTGRIFWSPKLEEIPRAGRWAIYDAMNDTLARLHKGDWQKLGLSDYGKPGNYFVRQIARWSKQWEGSRTRENKAIDRLAEWLPKNIPPGDATAICHGDFKLDNMVFHPSEPRVIGILDWELSTLGNPLADLAYNCIPYVADLETGRGFDGKSPEEFGIPTYDEYVAAYYARTGYTDRLTPFHFAFSFFRLAVIVEGVLARAKMGNASSAQAMEVGARGIALAERGWKFVS